MTLWHGQMKRATAGSSNSVGGVRLRSQRAMMTGLGCRGASARGNGPPSALHGTFDFCVFIVF